jgi:colanic acid biosynthesis protein WcaH
MLSPEDYINVIENTQLVSIDLIIRSAEDSSKILVGKRKHKPAKGYWFVPGSRLYKNERWESGVERLSQQELGYLVKSTDTTLMDINDHIYKDNFLGRKDDKGVMINTHYLCIGLETTLDPNSVDILVFSDQHSDICWMNVSELLERDDVHQYTKEHFLKKNNLQFKK